MLACCRVVEHVGSDDQIAMMKRAGTLHEHRPGEFTISGISINGHRVPEMAVEIVRGAPPFAKYMPEPDRPVLSFGYELFDLYQTVFDFEKGSLTLIQYAEPAALSEPDK